MVGGIGNGLQGCLVHPSHVILETPREIGAIFVVSIAPILEQLYHTIDYAVDMTRRNKYMDILRRKTNTNKGLGVCLSLLDFYLNVRSIRDFCQFPLVKESLRVPVKATRLFSLYRVFLTWTSLCRIFFRIVSPVLRTGMLLYHRSNDEAAVRGELERRLFPLDNPKNVVIAGSADSLLFSILETQTLPDHSSVVLVPGVLFYPHTSLVPFLRVRGVEVIAYDIDLISYSADIDSITSLLVPEVPKTKKNYFVVLPSIQGRSVLNLEEVLRVLRVRRVFAVELCVPTIGMTSPFPVYSQRNDDIPDAIIVSLKGVCEMNGAVARFKEGDVAQISRDKIRTYQESRLSWVHLIRHVFHFFLSNRLGFGLAINAVALLSTITSIRRRSMPLTKIVEENPSSSAYQRVREVGPHNSASLNTMQASSTTVANMLVFFAKWYSQAVLDEQCEVLWGTLVMLPPYITVLSVGDRSRPLDCTQVAGTSIILYVQNAAGITEALRSIGFDAIHLETNSADDKNIATTCSLQNKVIHFSRTQVGCSTHGKFVLVPLNYSVSLSRRKQLVNKLLSLPKDFFISSNAESYSSEEVITLLDQIKTRKTATRYLSKL